MRKVIPLKKNFVSIDKLDRLGLNLKNQKENDLRVKRINKIKK